MVAEAGAVSSASSRARVGSSAVSAAAGSAITVTSCMPPILPPDKIPCQDDESCPQVVGPVRRGPGPWYGDADASATTARLRLGTGASLSALTTTPWRRAPLLRRSPAVLVAVLAAGVILGAAAATTPLYLSSAANAALAVQLAERCPSTVGFQIATSGTLGA